MANENLSCLICTHRAPASMKALLDSLRIQDWSPGDEVILIDNGVAAGRLAELEEPLRELRARGPKVLLEKEERLGLTNARLKAFALAKNAWFVLLDDDNVLAPHALKSLHKCLEAHPELGGICPQIVPQWARPPAAWTVALGHQVLSYNTSSLSQPPYTFALWKSGVVGMRPPGGGMIVHRRAAEEFLKLAETDESVRNLGRKGTALACGEDFVLYDFLYRLGFPTAYDNSIVIHHQISSRRMEFSYLLQLLYYCNWTFGGMALRRFGRKNVLYAGLHGTARLIYEFAQQSLRLISWRMAVGLVAALAGCWLGTLSAFFERGPARVSS
jgi:glycosyltransferase involved in cell wall biosynthesis